MSDYRNFADSFFSTEIWQHEGKIPLIITLSVLLVIVVAFLFAQFYKNAKLGTYAFMALMVFGTSAIITMIFASFFVEGFNQNVADHNISVKYDDSKITTSYYIIKDKTVIARYTDGEARIDDQVKFVFDKNSVEPFIFQSTGSAENFEKITAAVTKSR